MHAILLAVALLTVQEGSPEWTLGQAIVDVCSFQDREKDEPCILRKDLLVCRAKELLDAVRIGSLPDFSSGFDGEALMFMVRNCEVWDAGTGIFGITGAAVVEAGLPPMVARFGEGQGEVGGVGVPFVGVPFFLETGTVGEWVRP
ncbi:MAG: hypothetical protein OXC11_01800 [Rhodospirillales bacterium]|nr:hypothetical protein [Rhodospirillales bacterium]